MGWKTPDDKLLRAAMGWDTTLEMKIAKGLLVANVFSSLGLGLLTELVLRYIIGVNFIGRRLFRAQNHKGEALTEVEIASVVRGFKHSGEPRVIRQATYCSALTKIDYKAADRDQKVLKVAEEVIQETIRYADAQFFREERSRMVSKISLN